MILSHVNIMMHRLQWCSFQRNLLVATCITLCIPMMIANTTKSSVKDAPDTTISTYTASTTTITGNETDSTTTPSIKITRKPKKIVSTKPVVTVTSNKTNIATSISDTVTTKDEPGMEVVSEGTADAVIEDAAEAVIEDTTEKVIEDTTQEEMKGHSPSIMKYSYDDHNDKIGPSRWNDSETGVLNATDNQNNCVDKQSWTTPLNIDTRNVVAPEEENVSDEDSEDAMDVHKTLVIFISDNIERMDWQFGHPSDVYHGLEIRSPHLGTFQINDRFDYIAQKAQGVDEYTNYDFSYASVFYCDTDKAGPHRSMHQIDGRKFPLEIDFIFYSQPPRIGMNNVICFDGSDRCETVGVMISVLGELGNEDNKRLQPLIDAAQRYEGPDFGTDDMDEDYVIPIHGPWSPTWIIPDSSDYYYYEGGSFPVPPCWFVSRVYVVKERIKISRRQLNTLSAVRTKREQTTDGRMPCTFSVLQSAEDPQDIKYNQWPYQMKGEDGRPMTKEDQRQKDARYKESKEARMRALARQGIYTDQESLQIRVKSELVIVALSFLMSFYTLSEYNI